MKSNQKIFLTKSYLFLHLISTQNNFFLIPFNLTQINNFFLANFKNKKNNAFNFYKKNETNITINQKLLKVKNKNSFTAINKHYNNLSFLKNNNKNVQYIEKNYSKYKNYFNDHKLDDCNFDFYHQSLR